MLQKPVLLLGKNGQVGWELQRSLAPLGVVRACGRDQADLSQPESLRALIREVEPWAIVNAAAYTAVDKAESEPELAQAINVDSVRVIGEEARALGVWVVHYSTDYVFDGEKREPYTVEDATNPQNVYGVTKRDGEEALQSALDQFMIFRTSWVFARRGGNFIKTMLRLAGERESLKVVADQHGAPTSAELIADVTARALFCVRDMMEADTAFADDYAGIYHLVSRGETTWRDLAAFAVDEARKLKPGERLKLSGADIEGISTEEYPALAKRPKNSRMDVSHTENVFGLQMPEWPVYVQRMIAELES